MNWTDFLWAIPAYFLGSIPTAVWVGRAKYDLDVREHGSKNAGATNTFRVLGKKAGRVVLTIDILKGMTAVLLPYFVLPLPFSSAHLTHIQLVASFMAVLGACIPGFRRIQRRKRCCNFPGSDRRVTAFSSRNLSACFPGRLYFNSICVFRFYQCSSCFFRLLVVISD